MKLVIFTYQRIFLFTTTGEDLSLRCDMYLLSTSVCLMYISVRWQTVQPTHKHILICSVLVGMLNTAQMEYQYIVSGSCTLYGINSTRYSVYSKV